ncbi:MAG TPA: hypothetical protein VM369_01545 [Candidatus Binatia bacterium]|nr:hypothetical protein [Candidatus Binatia bacterium]
MKCAGNLRRLATGGPGQGAKHLAAALAALALTACTEPIVRHNVTQPPAAQAPAVMFIATPEVGSLEQDELALRRNRQWAVEMHQQLRDALERHGIERDETAGQAVMPRLYFVYQKRTIKTGTGIQRQPGFVEIELQWKDLATGSVRAATFSKADLDPAVFGDSLDWGASTQDIVRRALREAAERFVATLTAGRVPPPVAAPAPTGVAAPAPVSVPAADSAPPAPAPAR